MDSEGPMIPFVNPSFFRKTKQTEELIFTKRKQWRKKSIKNRLHGMPWESSIATDGSDVVYMPFWEWQLSFFEEQLTNFQVRPTTNSSLDYVESSSGTHRMVTLVGSSYEYRYIRMTYLDGGAKSQIFTSVCYPRGNHPILGVDLLQFAGNCHLAIIDFQPLHQEGESHHDARYEHLLEPIRENFPSLQEPMTERFFDPSRYFSEQTLLGRFQSTDIITQDLWPAFQAYVHTHVKLLKKTEKSKTYPLSEANIKRRHAAYDTYVAERDPAHPMFASLFGAEFAHDFMYQVLFPLAEKKSEH